jgi:hypothetical protein
VAPRVGEAPGSAWARAIAASAPLAAHSTSSRGGVSGDVGRGARAGPSHRAALDAPAVSLRESGSAQVWSATPPRHATARGLKGAAQVRGRPPRQRAQRLAPSSRSAVAAEPQAAPSRSPGLGGRVRREGIPSRGSSRRVANLVHRALLTPLLADRRENSPGRGSVDLVSRCRRGLRLRHPRSAASSRRPHSEGRVPLRALDARSHDEIASQSDQRSRSKVGGAAMPMRCIAGTFRIVGSEPDGDSIRFYPDAASSGNSFRVLTRSDERPGWVAAAA